MAKRKTRNNGKKKRKGARKEKASSATPKADESPEQAEERIAYEGRLRHRLKLLAKAMEEGRVNLTRQVYEQVSGSIERVRYGADGEVDLSTVDGIVRSMALAIEGMEHVKSEKDRASLFEIQTQYFEFVEKNFTYFYEMMKSKNANPHSFAHVISKGPEAQKTLHPQINEFMEAILSFWKDCHEGNSFHIQELNGKVNGVFGGDLFPSPEGNLASKCGIYTDTVILPCPFMKMMDLVKIWPAERAIYHVLKHALSLLGYKYLACQDGISPIVVIAPDESRLSKDYMEQLQYVAGGDCVKQLNKAFGLSLSTMEEAFDYFSALDTVDKLSPKIKDGARIVTDVESEKSPLEQIVESIKEYPEFFPGTNVGQRVVRNMFGRMSQGTEILMKSRNYKGCPLIDAPTSWKYFQYKLECESEELGLTDAELKDLHVVRGLQRLAANEMTWLGNIPAKALIEVRRQGALEEIRNIIGSGVSEIALEKKGNFFRTADRVMDNIHGAFDDHIKKVAGLNKKTWTFAGSHVGTWLVVGTIEMAAICTGSIGMGIATIVADQLLDVPKLKDLPKEYKSIKKEKYELHRSPVGLLYAINKTSK